MSDPDPSAEPWWKEAVVYQIYPKSFNDADGDGVGDLRGIEGKVDYLADLGVDAVWLCPVYESPQADNGYDISDYRSIADVYGDMDDWRRLLGKLHDRDIRLVMDLVLNHTSDEHPWFVESRSSPDSEYRDYYVWREGDGDDPPNNWESVFGGSAWTYDERAGAYYLHLFDERQPDLNWTNPRVREDLFELIRWWLDQGIDGFRLDVVNLVSKPEGLPDGDPDAGLTGAGHFMNGPNVHEYVSEMVEEAIPDRDVLTIGETPGASVEDARQYVGPDGDGLSMVFQFEHVEVGRDGEKWSAGEWSLVEFKEVVARWQKGLADEGWNSIYLNNHDQPRMVSRFGDDDEYRRESAKLLGTLTHTLGGTPFVYQGEEIGMTNAPFPSRDELRDVEALNFVEEAIESGAATCYDDVRDAVERACRDNARTPMQWSDAEHAGFTDGEPWIDVNPNHEWINVERAREDAESVWHYYRDLIALRSESDVLVYGDFELLCPGDESIFAYTRTLGDDRGLVVLNVDDQPTRFEVPGDLQGEDLALAITNADDVPDRPSGTLDLGPYEARVYLDD